MNSRSKTKTINQISKDQMQFAFMKEDKPTKKKAPTKNVRERIVTGEMEDGNEVVASEYVTYGVSIA